MQHIAQPTGIHDAATAAVSVSKRETSPFLDPLVRSLILGVGAGIACEAGHVFFKVKQPATVYRTVLCALFRRSTAACEQSSGYL
jgi:hypothetical protein